MLQMILSSSDLDFVPNSDVVICGAGEMETERIRSGGFAH